MDDGGSDLDSLVEERASGEEEDEFSQVATSSQRKKQKKQRKKKGLENTADKVASSKKNKVDGATSTGAGVRPRTSTKQTDIRFHTRSTAKGTDGKVSKEVTRTQDGPLRSSARDDG
jgi:hypothetical protein